MANAKRCDICGKYFPLPEDPGSVLYKTYAGSVELYKMSEKVHHTQVPEGFVFDACDDCVQEIVDHILEKRATWEIKEE